MELTSGQRKAAFGAIVVALAGLGAFLLAPGARQTPTGSSAASPPPSGTARPASPAPAATVTSPPTPATTRAVDIFRLLPFTQADLNRAVGDVQRFAVAYGTYSYQQNPANYIAPMRGLVGPELATVIERGYATPGVADVRLRQRQVATATADVTGLRAFGSSSLVFVVQVAQSLTTTQGKSSQTTQYAVTITRTGAGWQVTDIQLASAGNS